ncbi:hypothetical protein B0H12DRAFT_595428 [Mycena haematopus]|nr:hypothetical protein B0H12DRAFT_595428 [Mycena haematopus]
MATPDAFFAPCPNIWDHEEGLCDCIKLGSSLDGVIADISITELNTKSKLLSSPPSSSGSTRSKRSYPWCDDDESSNGSEPVKRRSLSPFSISPSSGDLPWPPWTTCVYLDNKTTF